MAHVRISTMIPKAGEEALVEEILGKLPTFYVTVGGYITGYHLRPHEGDPNRRMGRIGVWESEEHAVHAAQTEHALALRSELLRAVDENSHEENLHHPPPKTRNTTTGDSSGSGGASQFRRCSPPVRFDTDTREPGSPEGQACVRARRRCPCSDVEWDCMSG